MSEHLNIITQSPIDRLRHFGGLIFMTAMIIFVSFFVVHNYYKAEEARLTLQIQEDHVAMKRAEELRKAVAQTLAGQNYVLRNDLEEIVKKESNLRLKQELNEVKEKLAAELQKTEYLLNAIVDSKQNQKEKQTFYPSDIRLSIFSEAHAQEMQSTTQPKKLDPYVLYLSTAIISLLSIVCCFILVFSKDSDKVKFAQTTTHSIIGFAIGAVSGSNLTIK